MKSAGNMKLAFFYPFDVWLDGKLFWLFNLKTVYMRYFFFLKRNCILQKRDIIDSVKLNLPTQNCIWNYIYYYNYTLYAIEHAFLRLWICISFVTFIFFQNAFIFCRYSSCIFILSGFLSFNFNSNSTSISKWFFFQIRK